MLSVMWRQTQVALGFATFIHIQYTEHFVTCGRDVFSRRSKAYQSVFQGVPGLVIKESP